MTGRSLCFQGYGASVSAALPDDITAESLTRYVAPELTLEAADRRRADLLLTRWDGVYHLVLGERRYGPYRTLQNAMRGVSNGVHFMIGKRSPHTFLHAGAVELDGAALVFPGRSRWGKSTLVRSLVEQGCGYLSDEYAVVSNDGLVFPFAKPIRLRAENGGAEYVAPPGVCAPDGLPCAALILTRYEADVAWKPETLTPGFAILGAIPSALQNREYPEQVLGALRALVEGAICLRGSRGDGEPTVETLRGLQAMVSSTKERAQA